MSTSTPTLRKGGHREAEATRFLEELYGNARYGKLSMFTLPEKRTTFWDLTEFQKAASQAVSQASNVYLGIGLQRGIVRAGGRGKEEDVVLLPGLWFDLDVRDEVHKQKDLPPSKEEALEFVRCLPHAPTLIVDSGHGLQLYWLFDEPLTITTGPERAAARQLSERWQQKLIAMGQEQGWKFDNTGDLARIFRLPGTLNRKREPHLPVRLISCDGPRYDPTDLTVRDEPTPTPAATEDWSLEQALAAPGSPEQRVSLTKDVVSCIRNDDRFPRNPWIGVAHAIRASCGEGMEEEAREIFVEWSDRRIDEDVTPGYADEVWNGLGKTKGAGGYRRLLFLAGPEYSLPDGHPWDPRLAFAEASAAQTPEGVHELALKAINWVVALGPEDHRFLQALQDALSVISDNPSARYQTLGRSILESRLTDVLGRQARTVMHMLELPETDAEVSYFATVTELQSEEDLLEPPECVVPRLAYRGRATILAGPDKSGKSTLMAHATAALSREEAFLDGTTIGRHGGQIAWVGLEEAIGDAIRRFADLNADGSKINVVRQADGNLLNRLRELLTDRPADLVVIDSLTEYARITLGEPPKSGDDSAWATVVRPLVQLTRDFDIAVVILHHVRKSDGQYRGSTEIAAAADALLELSQPKSGADPTLRRITGRGRAGMCVAPFSVQLGPEGYVLSDGTRLSDDAIAVNFIRQNPGISKSGLRRLMGVRDADVRALLMALMKEGVIENRGSDSHWKLHLRDSAAEAFPRADEPRGLETAEDHLANEVEDSPPSALVPVLEAASPTRTPRLRADAQGRAAS